MQRMKVESGNMSYPEDALAKQVIELKEENERLDRSGEGMKPILFNTAMVRAIFDGRKTVTRRVVKWMPYHESGKINFNFSGMSLGHYYTGVPESGYVLYSRGRSGSWNQRTKPMHCPYQPGDILWVRETWAEQECEYCSSGIISLGGSCTCNYVYRANYGTTEDDSFPPSMFRWRPSIHMPREAARLFLLVKSVRVERLQDITGRDVLSEGVDNGKSNPTMGERWENMQRMAFAELWDSINGKKYPWESNPWVFVIEFRRCTDEEVSDLRGK